MSAEMPNKQDWQGGRRGGPGSPGTGLGGLGGRDQREEDLPSLAKEGSPSKYDEDDFENHEVRKKRINPDMLLMECEGSSCWTQKGEELCYFLEL